MNRELDPTAETAGGDTSLLVLTLLAFLAGAASGLLGAVFRLVLERADPVPGLGPCLGARRGACRLSAHYR